MEVSHKQWEIEYVVIKRQGGDWGRNIKQGGAWKGKGGIMGRNI